MRSRKFKIGFASEDVLLSGEEMEALNKACEIVKRRARERMQTVDTEKLWWYLLRVMRLEGADAMLKHAGTASFSSVHGKQAGGCGC